MISVCKVSLYVEAVICGMLPTNSKMIGNYYFFFPFFSPMAEILVGLVAHILCGGLASCQAINIFQMTAHQDINSLSTGWWDHQNS
ncbi:hypothetical protein GDO78_008965 [Eleutherodactylus coqui]|uniref:Uncharacterized protein n=1 Tax=Eleutherodactylus coqui TaxID=57060 RepID=A0A8J6FED5_ELECQ|nr:hypothetical protein GDO78_008965 [Eleutherodactylus coqui]